MGQLVYNIYIAPLKTTRPFLSEAPGLPVDIYPSFNPPSPSFVIRILNPHLLTNLFLWVLHDG